MKRDAVGRKKFRYQLITAGNIQRDQYFIRETVLICIKRKKKKCKISLGGIYIYIYIYTYIYIYWRRDYDDDAHDARRRFSLLRRCKYVVEME